MCVRTNIQVMINAHATRLSYVLLLRSKITNVNKKKNGNFWRCVIDCEISFSFPYYTVVIYRNWYCNFLLPVFHSCCACCRSCLRQRHVLQSNRNTWNWICRFKYVMSKYSQWHNLLCGSFSDGKIYDWKIMFMVLESSPSHTLIVGLLLQLWKISNSFNIIMWI